MPTVTKESNCIQVPLTLVLKQQWILMGSACSKTSEQFMFESG